MTPQDGGRHCAVCDKVVVDFSEQSNQQIVQYISEQPGKVCGRIKIEQTTPFIIPEPRWIRTAPKWQHFLLAIALCFFADGVYAQGDLVKPAQNVKYLTGDTTYVEDQNNEHIFGFIDISPTYPGGEAALRKFLKENIKPVPNETGTVYLGFTVSVTGEILDPKVIRGVPGHPALGEEALRVLRLMPNWIPSRSNGKPQATTFTLPVNFR